MKILISLTLCTIILLSLSAFSVFAEGLVALEASTQTNSVSGGDGDSGENDTSPETPAITTPEPPDEVILSYVNMGDKGYQVHIKPTQGCEYSFDGIKWSLLPHSFDVIFSPGETVTGYKRFKAIPNRSNASDWVSAQITLPEIEPCPNNHSNRGLTLQHNCMECLDCGAKNLPRLCTTENHCGAHTPNYPAGGTSTSGDSAGDSSSLVDGEENGSVTVSQQTPPVTTAVSTVQEKAPKTKPSVSAVTFTSADALTILKYSVGEGKLSSEQRANFDFNGDGIINSKSALFVLRIVAGLEVQ